MESHRERAPLSVGETAYTRGQGITLPQRLQHLLKWLYPGLKIKRWFCLGVGGGVLCGIGIAHMTTQPGAAGWFSGLVHVGLGLSAMVAGFILMVRSVLDAVFPAPQRDVIDLVFERRHLQKGLKVVVIGGGTGLSTLLQGLKVYTHNITAIVTVADDGGSSGRLREEFGILPPGDIRNCLVALADAEPLMQRLFQHRFVEGAGLRGHTFGNLFITALTRITGDFERAVQAASRVLAIRGRVIPSTYANVQLVAKHDNGSLTVGESNISRASRPIRQLWLEPNDPLPIADALQAIHDADLVVMGPGSLFTSILPNLLVPGLVEAIVHSQAVKVYVCNVMTQFRETHGFSASDHVTALVTHTHPRILEVCVVTTGSVPTVLLENYRREQAFRVKPDVQRIQEMGYQVLTGAFMSTENYVRHDPDQLARALIQLRSTYRRDPRLALNGWTSSAHNGHPSTRQSNPVETGVGPGRDAQDGMGEDPAGPRTPAPPTFQRWGVGDNGHERTPNRRS
ncbi:MAG: YvcK family protein [Candidatus Omnitrophica bacterium]|nr:YvcK family protein [Candidatus Omnitrophota bacterium]